MQESREDSPVRDLTAEDILSCLSKSGGIHEKMDLEFMVDEISKKLTRRQAIILRLLLIEEVTQTEVGKMLGFSAPTICLEMKKIREIITSIIVNK